MALVGVVFSGASRSVHSSDAMEQSAKTGVAATNARGGNNPAGFVRAKDGPDSQAASDSTPASDDQAATASSSDQVALNHAKAAPNFFPALPLLPAITATKVDALVNDDGDGKIDPTNGVPATEERITYTVTINNSGTDATHVKFNDTIDTHTTLVAGSINTQPIASADTYSASGNIPLSLNAAGGVLGNDVDPDNGSNTGLTVTEVQGAAVNVGAATNTTATGRGGVKGSVTVASNGSFTYEPPPGFEGADTFTYKTSDGTATDTATVTINITGMVWFISNTGGGLNRGTFSNPFTTIASFDTANAATGAIPDPKTGDFISLRTGSGTYSESDGINLRNTQKLIGNAIQFSTVFTAATNSSSAYTTFAGAAGSAPTIAATAGNGVDLADSNTVRGLNVGATSGFKINGGAVGSPVINTINLTGAGGAINVSTSGAFGANVTFATLESTSSAASNISLVGVTGTLGVTSGGTGLSGSAASSNGITINGGSVSLSYPGNITKANAGSLVNVLGGHNTGTLAFTGTLSATAGDGLQFNNADGTYNFSGTTTLNGGDAGIDITSGSAGTFSFNSSTSITNPTNEAIVISGGTQNVTYSGSFNKTNGTRGILVQSNTAGTILFDGSAITKTITTTGANNAIELATNSGVTINFTNGGLVLTASGSGAGFTATGGGTITVQGSNNTLTSATGTALNVNATNLGLSGLTFLSINSNGGTNGIVLNNTGTTAGTNGGLSVTGTGSTSGSGGTIQNKDQGAVFTSTINLSLKNMNFTNANTGDSGGVGQCDNTDPIGGGIYNLNCKAAINLNTVTTVSFDNLFLDRTIATGGEEVGINGRNVAGLTILNSTVQNYGDEVNEGEMRLFNLTGTCAFTNSAFKFGSGRSVEIRNASGTLNLTISSPNSLATTNSIFSDTQSFPATGNDGLEIKGLASTVTMNIDITNTRFLRNITNGMQVIADNSANMTVNVKNCHFDRQGGTGKALDFDADNNAVLKFNVNANPIMNAGGGAGGTVANFFADRGGKVEGHIRDNPSIVGGGVGFGGSGIVVQVERWATGVVDIHNNTVSGIEQDSGINVFARSRATGDPAGGRLDATIDNNNVTIGNAAAYDIVNRAGGGTATDANVVCGNVHHNTTVRGAGAIAAFQARVANVNSDLFLQGFTTNEIVTWNNNSNTPINDVDNFSAESAKAGTCNTPTNPIVSLENPFAEPREVLAQSNSPFVDEAAPALPDYSNYSIKSGMTVTNLAFANNTDDMPASIASLDSRLAAQLNNVEFLFLRPINENTTPEAGTATAQVGEPVSTSSNGTAELAANQSADTTTTATAEATSNVAQAESRNVQSDAVALAHADNTLAQSSRASVTKNPKAMQLSHAIRTRTRTSALAAAAMVAGETVTVDGGAGTGNTGFTLPAGKSITVTWQVTLNNLPNVTFPYPTGGPQVSNQGTVTADSIAPVLTDDPAPPAPLPNGATDPTVTYVDLFNSQTNVTSSNTSVGQGDPITFTATVSFNPTGSPSGTPGTPTGTVQFTIDGNPLVCDEGSTATQTLNGSGVATCTTSTINPVGSPHTINAIYSGDGNFDTSTDPTPVSQTVIACISNPVVTSNADSGANTLRNALANVCNSPSNNITFNLGAGPHTITALSTLVIAKNANITNTLSGTNGPLTVTANGGNFRVFRVDSPVTTASLSGFTVTGANTTGTAGGGIFVGNGTTTLTGMLFTGNTVINSGGGGVGVGSGATINIRNSTISGNTATFGGGIHNNAGTLNLLNDTVTNNTADGNIGGGPVGGPSAVGGGIDTTSGTATNIKNSIVAGNSATSSTNIAGTSTDQGNNILTGDPRLAALANNGGASQTHALLSDSPALDAGDNTASDAVPLTTDQRGTGFARKRDAADVDTTQTVDIGAFEADPSVENIPDKSTNEDTPLSFIFNVGDSASAFDSITATSGVGDQTLVPNANIVVGADTPSTRQLTITPAANQNGTATITVTVTKTVSGTPVSMSDTFVLTVNAVNDPPSFSLPGNPPASNEDAGPQTVNTYATSISQGPGESGQLPLTFNVSVTGTTGSLAFTSAPAIDPTTGNLTYTASPNTNGTASISVTLSDSGSNTPPNSNTSAAQLFTITVNGVNDPPSFVKGADQTVNEDAGAQTVPGWATSISQGPGESGQTPLTFNVSVTGTTGSLAFSSPPAIDGTTGNLTYTTAADTFGTANLSVTLSDSGSNVPPNSNTSAAQTFTITVNAVNDPPSFTLPGNPPASDEDAGAQTVNAYATGISQGPNESGQTPLTFNVSVTGTTGSLAFTSAPAIDATTGNLTYTASPNTNGTASISVTLSDSGSNTPPNSNTSAAQTFTITVNPINDPPSFTIAGNPPTVNESAGPQTVNAYATSISQGPNETGQTPLTFNISSTGTTGTLTFSTPPAIDATTGNLTYTATNGTSGTASFNVTLSDSGSNVPPNSNTSAAQSFTISVNGVNDPPVNTVPGPITIPQDTVLTFIGANQISVTDPDAATAPGDGIITVTLTATNGTLTLSSTTGLTFSVGDGTADTTMTFDGLIADINSALTGMTFTPTSGFTGGASVQIVSNDQGKTGTGGVQTDTDTVNITVTAPTAMYINEIAFNPDGSGQNEYIELRGTPSSVIPAGTYLVAIDGDNGNLGDVTTYINLSGLSFGSNGFLVLLQQGNTYTTAAGATVVTSTATGFSGLPGGIFQADGGATNLENDSVTFMLIETGVSPTLTDDIDFDNDGTPDGSVYAGWSIRDSVGNVDGGSSDHGYGALNYATTGSGSSTGTTVPVTFTLTYVGRRGDTTGSAAADWVASGALGGAAPNFTLNASGTQVEPSSFAGKTLDHIGSTNFLNKAPVNTVPGAQATDEDVPLTFTGATKISIADSDANGASVKVTLTATNGTISLSGTAGLTFTPAGAGNDGTDDVQMIFTGTVANINTALDGLTFTPTLNYSGPASVAIDTDDQGNTGVDGAKTDSDSVNITVNAVNDPPSFVISAAAPTVNEDAGPQTVSGFATAISQGAGDPPQTLTFNVTPAGTTGNIAFSSGPAINAATGDLTYTTSPDTNGTATFNVTLSDNGSNVAPNSNTSGIQSFTITVTAVNDAPSFLIPSNPPTVNEDAPAQTVPGFATSFQPGPVTATDEGGQTLVGYTVTSTGTTGNLTFTSGPSIDNAGQLTYTPTGNTSGTATFNAVATDSGSGSAPNVNQSAPVSFTITVTGQNDAPVLDNAGNMSLNAINEDVANASNPGTLVSDIIASAGGDRITDVDAGAVEGIAVTAVDNTNGTWQFSIDNGTNWTPFGTPDTLNSRLLASDALTRVRFIPNLNFNGTVDPGITFRAWDQSSGTNGNTADTTTVGGITAFSTATETASITVNAVNDAPTAVNDTLPNVAEDSGANAIPFAALTGNDLKGPADENGQSLIVKTVSSPVGGTVSILSGNVIFTPTANYNGPASFQYTVEDNGTPPLTSAAAATASFNVTPVADTPSVTNATTNEDTQTTSGLVITRNPADGAEVTSFQITGITGGTLFQNNGTTQINNGDFISVAQGGLGLKFTPALNSNANGSFTVQASLSASPAGLGGGTATATITVNPVNDAPTLDPIGNLVINEDAPLQTVNLTGITAGAGETQTLSITATSNNTGVIPNPTVNYSSPNATGTLTFTPVANQSGSALITVTVNDGGGTANGGVETVVRTFTVTVNAVNDAPVNIVPGAQTTIRNTVLTFGAANLIATSDVDAGATTQVTLTATNGTLTLSSTVGLAFTTGDGTNDATMTFTGPLSAVNAALNGLTFTPTTDYTGAASVQITTNDLGNTGAGGPLSDTDTVNITVLERMFQFSSTNFTVGEGGGHATITVTRTGGTSQPGSVDYETGDLSGLINCDVNTGNASPRCDFTAVGGRLNFIVGQASASFEIPIVNDVYVEGPETLPLILSNPQGGILGTPSTATLTITDDDLVPGAPNPIDTRSFFVRSLYMDILNREPDAPGLAGWLDRLNTCPHPGETPQDCDEIEVASDFFRSPEFFQRAYYIYRFYEVGLGRKPSYDEYQHDFRMVAGFLTDAELEQRKQQYAIAFSQRPEFRARYDQYDSANNALAYVDALSQTAGVTLANRDTLGYNLVNSYMQRWDVLRAVVESPEVSQKFFNKAFVVIGYFAFLRRDPDAAYLVWLDKLNTTGDEREMIRGFIQSQEYRKRFGP